MKLFLKIILIFFTLSVFLKAEPVSKIVINGKKRVSEETIKV